MSAKKTKLELTWIGKEHRPKLEPRILLEEPDKSHHAKHRVSDGDLFDNMLIRGDNLLGLKALEQEFALTLEEKLESQKQIKAIEAQRNDKRRSLFEAQDAIDRQREVLIEKIEGKLSQETVFATLLTIRWIMN